MVSVAVGLAGAGRRAAEAHAPLLASSRHVRFAGVWGRTPGLAQQLAWTFDVPSYARYADLLDNCDAVTFAVPPGPQATLATAAVEHGVAVLLELPIGADLADAERLVEAADTTGVVSQVALTWRYAPAVRSFLTTAVSRIQPLGGTGRLVSSALRGDPQAQQSRLEHGVLLEQGPDLIDLLDAALGRIVGVRAHGDPLGWVGLLLEHAGGRFSEATLCETTGVEPARAEVEVFGPGGAAAVDCADAVGPDAYDTMIGEFAVAVEHRTPHALDARRGLHLQEVLGRAESDLFTSA